jgi:sigma-54 dependent transcriptional regulator, acetoin dehydrogenase operon transcriptional activator AcoR
MLTYSLTNDRRGDDRTGYSSQSTAIGALRDRFLADPTTDLSMLRPVIARSWQRSARHRIDPSQRFINRVAKPQFEEDFLEVVEPVVAELAQLCEGSKGCISLSDRFGTLAMFRGDAGVVRRADKMFATCGGCISEEAVGTNSDGTALEEGDSVQVWGAEHFNEAFADSSCSSVLIRDPLRRSVLGVLSLTLPSSITSTLDPTVFLMTLQSAVARVTSALTGALAPGEQALLASYLREIRKRGCEAVVAMDDKTTIASRTAVQLLKEHDYGVLAGYAREALHLDRPIEREVSFGSDRLLNVQIRPVSAGDASVGTVIRVKELKRPSAISQRPCASDSLAEFTSLIGQSVAHRRMLKLAHTAASHGLGCYIVGDSGTGKTLLAEALAKQMGRGIAKFDADGLASVSYPQHVKSVLAEGKTIIVRHADRLDSTVRDALVDLLSTVDRPSVILTARRVSDELLPLVSAVQGLEIHVPSVRTKREDIPLLANHFIAALNPDRRASARLLDMLSAVEWNDNIRQLKEVVQAATLRATGHEVKVDDLSDVHRRSLAHSRLSRLEFAELDLIREALIEAKGNRVRAAEILRIGRSTLYRKIDSYTCRGFQVCAAA